MKKLIKIPGISLLMTIFLSSCINMQDERKVIPEVTPRSDPYSIMYYNVPNESRNFGEPLTYNVLQFVDDNDSVRTLYFTDSSLNEHLRRAERKLRDTTTQGD